jgi:protein-disulfide isomerase
VAEALETRAAAHYTRGARRVVSRRTAVIRRRQFVLTSGLAVVAPALMRPAVGQERFEPKVLGDPDAPVEIREYSSLTCPHCRTFHVETLPVVKADYIDTGKAKLVYRDFPLDLRAWLASAVAHCAGPERFFTFLNVLYDEQERWAAAPTTGAARRRLREGGLVEMWREAGRNEQEVDSLLSVAGTVNTLIDLAQFGGLPPERTRACLADFELLDWILAAQQEGQQRYDVSSTPTILVDGEKLVGAQTPEVMAREIEAALAEG